MKKMSLQQLEKLESNPKYKLSQKQKDMLASYRAKRFKNNPDFIKHSTELKTPKANELTNGKPNNN